MSLRLNKVTEIPNGCINYLDHDRMGMNIIVCFFSFFPVAAPFYACKVITAIFTFHKILMTMGTCCHNCIRADYRKSFSHKAEAHSTEWNQHHDTADTGLYNSRWMYVPVLET